MNRMNCAVITRMTDELKLLNVVFSNDNREVRSFPGALPISLSRQQLQNLPFGYVWSIKVDGERAFLFVCCFAGEYTCWTLSRDLQRTNLTKGSVPIFVEDCEISILDVEVCEGVVYIFDVLMFNNVVVTRKCVLQRLEMAYKLLTLMPNSNTNTPWWWSDLPEVSMTPTQYNRDVTCALQPKLQLVVKPFFLYCKLHVVLPLIKPRVVHDGIVFTRLFQEYKSYRSEPLAFIKWKNIDQITIDCVIRVNSKCRPNTVFGVSQDYTVRTSGNIIICVSRADKTGVRTQDRNQNLNTPNTDIPLAYANVDERHYNPLTKLDGTVGEFGWCDKVGWFLHRLRPDKMKSNSLYTVVKTIENLKDEITVAQL